MFNKRRKNRNELLKHPVNNLMKYIFAYNITKLQLIYVTDISIIKEIKGDVKNR